MIVFCASPDDAQPLVDALGRERVQAVSSPAAAALDYAILVDTPDTDSEMCPEHRPTLERLARQSDVLLCVLNAENPKRRDNLDFLRPLVERFPHESLFAVLSHCDRQPEDELRHDVLPDLAAHMERSWGRVPQRIFCVSGRRHLKQPNWATGAEPLHDFDEYDALRDTLFHTLNQGSVLVDSRLRQAQRIETLIDEAIADQLTPQRTALEQVETSLGAINRTALVEAVDALRGMDTQTMLGVDLMLYQRLAQLWWGPVGWLLALWARLLVFGGGLFNVLRFGNPIGQLYGVVATALRYWKTGQALEDATSNRTIQLALERYRSVVAREWPDEGKKLVAAGFDAALLDPAEAWKNDRPLSQRVAGLWEMELTAVIERRAHALSNPMLQLLANGPVVGIMGYVAWQCLDAYRRAEYLSADFFRHALVTIVIVWLLSFIAVQLLVRLGGGRRILSATINRLLELARLQTEAAAAPQVGDELRALLRLEADTALPKDQRRTDG